MGCGAVCSTQSPLSLKQQQHSKQNILALLPHISVNAPLLPDTFFHHFTTSLRQNANPYLLRVSSRLFSTQQCPATIVQKWRVLLFGLDKDDYTYKRCVGFAAPPEEKSSAVLVVDGKGQAREGDPQYHSCFEQIEKDLNRTFDFKQHTKQLFEETLKKIANHFPTMGYTQGVNFVVGYLLILGYESTDAFWLFVHLAMNRRYLLLGLYEDGFPLANIYTLIFKNMLKRIDKDLYSHIYESLMLDDSVWIFKWFITCYLYSFPIQSIKYVWDIFIEMGSLGLVYFAVALVKNIREKLMEIDDPCDMSQYLQSLKNLGVFNENVKMSQVVESCYEVTLIRSDFDGVEQLRPSFYQQYFKMYQNQLPNPQLPQLKIPNKKAQKMQDTKINSHLEQWWVKLLQERLQFIAKPSPQKSSPLIEQIPEQLKQDYEDMQKSLRLLQDIIIQNQSNKYSQHNIQAAQSNDNYFNELVIPDIEDLSPQFTSGSPSQSQFQNRLQTKISYDVGEIDQLEEYSDSNGQNDRYENTYSNMNPPSQEASIYIEANNNNRPNSNLNITSILGGLDQKRKKKQPTVKAGHLKIDTAGIRSGFGLAGQNILSNLSSCQSQTSSIDSKYTSHKPKKQKENNLPRTKSNKVRIEEYTQRSGISNDLSSEHESSIDHRTEKNSYSNLTSRQTKKNNMNDLYIQRRTEQELMANSHGPEKKMSTNQKQSTSSEIQIFNGQGLFKKKKRTFNRNSIVTSINQDLPQKRQSGLDIKPKRTLNDEQSLESVLELSVCRKAPNQHNYHRYETESVK